ncbi:hypothetical protein J7384_12250 [Endozoicomonas sp. G2_1]|uniref:hypothetical protein n=1 Tax=Endozoicomonas sp. G2_1 TaxID=2821091 RepID=UPI001ADCB7D8|nr:hypothetical protein [Endozoicomonas sp. G2_1]MBO9491135.1 hypothetical protein [Endozoicomonas sp. G2_1]
MGRLLTVALGISALLIGGCASQEQACEDVVLASEQIQECQSLQRQIVKAKGRPVIRGELERRFQQDCIDIRYYRDDKQVAICNNKASIEALQNKLKQ